MRWIKDVGPATVLAASLALFVAACGSPRPAPGGPDDSPVAGGPASPVETCRRGDIAVDREADCLQDEASCYRRADGRWCTGPREPVCPAGSVALVDGLPCPVGARCFEPREGLRCVVEDE